MTFSKEVVQWNTRFFQNLKNLDTNVQSRFSHFCHKYYVSSNAKKDENPWSFSRIMKWYRQESSSDWWSGKHAINNHNEQYWRTAYIGIRWYLVNLTLLMTGFTGFRELWSWVMISIWARNNNIVLTFPDWQNSLTFPLFHIFFQFSSFLSENLSCK